jgi:putative Ca2+/H+ antiporter (TMEM165/GDT1 family)
MALNALTLLLHILLITYTSSTPVIDTTDLAPKNFLDSFVSGFSLIFVSEIGDRTFFMIMIYAATNSFLKTFILSSFTMLALNIISLLVGFAIPFFLYRDLIDWLGILIFTIFGIKMFYDAYSMKDEFIEDELEEVKEELVKEDIKELKDKGYGDLKDELLEKRKPQFKSSWAFVTSLVIAEMGDKSQISAIVLGAINNFWGVLFGTSFAFLMCILISILFGNILAKKLTHKQLTICGGTMFLIFAILYAIQKLFKNLNK